MKILTKEEISDIIKKTYEAGYEHGQYESGSGNYWPTYSLEEITKEILEDLGEV